MSLSVPQLDVFYIDFSAGEKNKKEKEKGRLLSSANTAATGVVSLIFPVVAINLGALALGASITPKIYKSVKGLIDNNRFHIIGSEEELKDYENPQGNAWVINDKSLKKRQYYIRHPKKNKQHILIEAGSFYDYIEKEYKYELENFIMSHCSAKVIRIERIETVETKGNGKGNIKGDDASSGIAYAQTNEQLCNRTEANGISRVEPLENYYWLDKSIMLNIETLKTGTYTEKDKRDFTFGLSIKEAKAIGLDINMHKKFSYTIHIEC